MSDSNPASGKSAPWHLWVVGVLALLWNSVGAFDYYMTQTHNASYMGKFTPEQLAYFYGFPAWVVATWALSVWGSVLGSILLLVRRRWAVPVFGVSLVTFLLTSVYSYVLSNGMEVMGGPGGLVFSVVIFAIAVALLLYARGMARNGVLR